MKKYSPFAIAALIIAAISLVLVCQLVSYQSAGTVDYSLVIATLAILITLLIGWQISQTLVVMGEYKKLKEEYDLKASLLRDEFKDAVSDATDLVLLRYADRENQLVVNAIYNIYRYEFDKVQCRLSIAILIDLLPSKVDKNDAIKEIANAVDTEWLHRVGQFIHEWKNLSDDEIQSLEDGVSKILNVKSQIKQPKLIRNE